MAKLILFFSRAGNNYVSGAIKKLNIGNTEVVANIIHDLTGAEMFKVEMAVSYSAEYSECIEQAKQDKTRDARPELKTYPESLDAYDTIYLGYPNYWGTIPMALFTVLEKYDFSGKIIKPFCTHEGSGMGSSERDIQKLCSGATVEKGLAIVGARVNEANSLIKQWI